MDAHMYLVLIMILSLTRLSNSYPHPKSNRTIRSACQNDVEYQHGGICCLNCPAGTFLKSSCTKAGERGQCEECPYGTYTEHSNGLHQCLRCTPCNSDQDVVTQCSLTKNTDCQCKPGFFCDPDQACEVCKKCLRCGTDEVVVRNCTATTNTLCKKQSQSSSNSAFVASVVVPLMLLAGIVAVVLYMKYGRGRSTNLPPFKLGTEYTGLGEIDCTNLEIPQQPVRPKSCIDLDYEHERLCEQSNSTAGNSQRCHIKPTWSVHVQSCFLRAPAPFPMPDRRKYEPFPRLVPVNGEESLKKCFDFFVEVDMDLQNRFFRRLELDDNTIKSEDRVPNADKIHALLNIWVEKEGRNASLNDLLQALLDLHQRRTAENIKQKALECNYYTCE